MIKKILIISSIVIAVAMGILLFATVYQPSVNVANIITPSPVAATPTPSPSPTPEIKILEDKDDDLILFLEFHTLYDVMTTSQYNYVMTSTENFFNSLIQANIRKYDFTQFKKDNDDLLYNRFSFKNDGEAKVPFNKFLEAFVDEEQEYLLILDEESLKTEGGSYKYTIDFFVNGEAAASFDFTINTDTLTIKIE